MKNNTPLVLIIDDNADETNAILRMLEPFICTVRTAHDSKYGWELYCKHPEPDLIVMNGCLDGNGHTLDSIPLIQQIRKAGYTGHMLAKSFVDDFVNEMMRAGCDLKQAYYHADDVGHQIIQFLNLQPSKKWWQFWK